MNTQRRIAPRSLHRAEVLLRQQQEQQADGWEFMTNAEATQSLTHSVYDLYDVVEDRQEGGYWLRRKDRAPLTRRNRDEVNRPYRRPQTRFSDVMGGLSDIFKGIERIDQATDGEVGRTLFDIFQ